LRYLLGLSGVEAAAVMAAHMVRSALLQRASRAFKPEFGLEAVAMTV
jgi:hypothetical protein